MKTELIQVADQNDLKPIRKAAQMLADGQLVAFPTETVYGIGCKAEPAAIDRLDQLKGRRPDKRYTLHVGDAGQLAAWAGPLSARAGKLVRCGLPGPLTLVIEPDPQWIAAQVEKWGDVVAGLLYRGGSIGIRYPDNPVACAILSAVTAPVVAPSANPADQPPATTPQAVSAYFDGQIHAIIDAPDAGCHYKNSSTVVKIAKKAIQILRRGAVDEARIRELTTIRILFVCTGNTCRSPMAEALAQQYFADNLGCSVDELDRFGYIINSAGVAAAPGMPASDESVQVCRDQGIDLAGHRSRPLTERDVDESDFIFVMGQAHRQRIVSLFPQAEKTCFLLNPQRDIADPIGQGRTAYQQCFKEIEKALCQRQSEIL